MVEGRSSPRVVDVERLPDALRAALDAGPVRPLVEYLGERLGLQRGEWQLRVFLSNGRLRGAELQRAGVSPAELEELAMREAPALR